MIRAVLVAFVSLSFVACAPHDDGATERSAAPASGVALEAVDPESLRAHVSYLSSDEMLGRGTGSPEKDAASEWMADELRAAGAVGAVDGSFFQEVPLVGYRKVPGGETVEIRGPQGVIPHELDVDFTWWPANLSERVELDAVPLVFVGYGVVAPEHEWDDYKDVDVSGKVLVFLNDDPQVEEDGAALFKGPMRTYYGRWTYKFEQARDRGALGAIVIHTTPSAGYGWQVIGDKGSRHHFALDSPGAGYGMPLLAWMHEQLAEKLAATVEMDLATWFEIGARREFRPFELPVTISVDAEVDVERATTRNVLGLIEGSDPELRDEIVVVTAHYDHLGHKRDDTAEDTIYNGAWDNAAGTAALLRMARGVGSEETPPRRSVLFFGVAAHEVGLLGSRWFAEHPPLDLSRFVANINVDMPQIFGTTRDIVAIGKEMSDLGSILADVAARFPVGGAGVLRVEGDPTPGAGRYYRSDQLHFARKGIPAIYVGPGDDYVEPPAVDPVEYRAAHYHQVSDEIRDVWDFEALARDARVVLATVLELANRDERPRWAAGSEFASVRAAQASGREPSAASTRATTSSTGSDASTISASSEEGSSRSRS